METEAYRAFACIYDEAMDNIPYERWGEDIHEYLVSQGISQGNVCELGCGTGNMTEIMAGYGYQMTGMDIAPDMLQKAMEKRSEKGLDICYVMQDMQELELPEPMDAILSVCDSMNYILEEDGLLKVFQGVAKYLKPDGIFLFDMKTEYCYREIMGAQTMVEHTENATYLWENYYYEEEHINEYALTIFQREPDSELYRKTEEYHEQRAYEVRTIVERMEQAGLTDIQVYGNRLGVEQKEKQERMYFVAKGRTHE